MNFTPTAGPDMGLPKLAKASLARPVFIVGGLRIEDKLRALERKFGVRCVWQEVYRDTGGATIAGRIAAGGACGVVILEHLMGHKTSIHLVSACKATGTPMTYAGKGGTASLAAAMEFLEQKV